ncbi:PAS domain-containing protein [Pseudomonas sp. NA13]
MSNIEAFPQGTRTPSDYESLLAMGANALDAFPGAVYVCDHQGWLVRYNSEAAKLWGRAPILGRAATVFAALMAFAARRQPACL